MGQDESKVVGYAIRSHMCLAEAGESALQLTSDFSLQGCVSETSLWTQRTKKRGISRQFGFLVIY